MGSASSSHVNSVKKQSQPAVLRNSKVHCQESELEAPSISSSSSTIANKTCPLDDHIFLKKNETDDSAKILLSSDFPNLISPICEFGGSEKDANYSGMEAPAAEVPQVKDLELQVKKLEKDLAKAQSHNLDLDDQVQNLRESLNCSKLMVISEEPEVEDDAKNEQICNLKTELEETKAEFQKLRVKHRRKVKILTAKLNEAQQSSQIQKLEMLEEVNQLKQSNKELTVKLKQPQTSHLKVSSEDESIGNLSDRTNLVVELSAQVSEQSQIIAELRGELAEKQKEIDSLSKSQKLWMGRVHNGDDKIDSLERSSSNLHISPHPPTSQISTLKSGRKKPYKIGQRRCIENTNNQLAFYKTVREVSSDSDSDWTNEIVASKIHSAPSAVRTEMTC